MCETFSTEQIVSSDLMINRKPICFKPVAKPVHELQAAVVQMHIFSTVNCRCLYCRPNERAELHFGDCSM